MAVYYIYLFHSCLIILLGALIYFLKTRRTNNVEEEHERILERRLAEFEPEPLIEDVQGEDDTKTPVIRETKTSINFIKVDFLSLATNRAVLDNSAKCIREYSVGTCGPRGFFGTTDIHLELEDRLAEFLKAESGIVYSSGLITILSCIHCYCKRGSTVFIDEQPSYGIKMGVASTRSRKVIFKHNDVADFASKAKGEIDANQKFLIIEGISSSDGSICPFPDFLAVCKQLKVRILLDESISFGVLGNHGRGITEYFGIDIDQIDVIMGSLENALAGYGGFCVGSAMTIHPQRLASVGFVFSASLPTFCAQAAISTLELIGDRPKKLRAISVQVDNFLCSFPELHVKSARESPLKIFSVRLGEAGVLTKRLHRSLEDNEVYLLWEKKQKVLKMNLFVDLFQSEILEEFFKVFRGAVKACLEAKTKEVLQ